MCDGEGISVMLSPLEVSGHCLYHASLFFKFVSKGRLSSFLKNINGQELLIA